MLGDSGPINDAVTAADAALDRCRTMMAAGQHRAALANVKQAVRLYSQLADNDPAVFRPDLALALQATSDCAAGAGKPEEALDAAQYAVEIFRSLAAESAGTDADFDPAMFGPYLGSALCTLAARLRDTGNASGDAAALEAVREGIHLFDHASADDIRRHRTALEAARLLRNELSPDEHLLDEEFDHEREGALER